MYNRIYIRWIDVKFVPWVKIVGEVEIVKNFNGVGERPMRRFVITKTQSSLSSTPAPGHKTLPKLTEEEQDRIEAMVRCYYEGITHSKSSVSWIKDEDPVIDSEKC